MGKIMSMVARKANRFNAENRAQRVLARDKPIAAPKYESNLRDMERTLELNPKFVETLNKKDAGLDNRLKSVYVTSEDSFIDYRAQKEHISDERPLPLDRKIPQDFEYGYKEPVNIKPGHCTLRQAIHFITQHQSEPEQWTATKIAADYKLKEPVVENILKYFKTFNIYLPDQKFQDRLLTQTPEKQLKEGTQTESERSS